MATYVLTIDGAVKTAKEGTLSLDATQDGQGRLTFEVVSDDGSYYPDLGDEVLLTEDGTRIFGGVVSALQIKGLGDVGLAPLQTRVTCQDFKSLAARRYVSGTLAAGNLKAALTWLLPYLTTYGVTLDGAQANGPALPEIPYDFQRLDAALDDLKQMTGWVWEIDANKVLRAFEPASTAAPYDVATGDGRALGDMTVEPTRKDYANRVYVRFTNAATAAYAFLSTSANFANGETVVIGSHTYTFQTVLTDVDGHVLLGADAEASLDNLIAAITLGGGSGTLYAASTTENTQVTAYHQTSTMMKAVALAAGTSGNSIAVSETAANASWITEGGGGTGTLLLGSDAALTNLVQANDAAEQASQGLWEKVYSYVEVTAESVAQELADALLAQAISTQTRVAYRTLQAGNIKPGQKQTLTAATRDVAGTHMVESVRLQERSGVVERVVQTVQGTTIQQTWKDTYKRWGGGSSASGTVAVGVGGGVSGGGTVGALAKWATPTSLTDSLVTESGSTVTVSGALTVTGLATFPNGASAPTVTGVSGGNMLTFTSTGTGATTWVQYLDTSSRFVWFRGADRLRLSADGTLAVLGPLTAAQTLTVTGLASFGGGASAPTITGVSGGNSLVFTSTGTGATSFIVYLTTASEWTLYNSGDRLKVGATGLVTVTNHVSPSTARTVDLGTLALKYRTLYAEELNVQTLVAQTILASVGGNVLVAPTTSLTADLTAVATSITVKHNSIVNGDRILLKANGNVEWMAVTSGAGGVAGAYTYSVTRNLDGTGANAWSAGDAVVSTGTTGDGYIDLYATSGVLAGTGPTIVGNVRTGTTWSDIEARWAIGNLRGLYGYSGAANLYGTAFGVPTAAWVKIDPTNGVRIGHNATTKVQIDASGNASFAGAVTATSGAIGGWAIGASTLTGGDATLDSSGNLTLGTGSNVVRLSADDATYRLWIGHATAASAPFSVTKAGALVATGATISGAITATSGSVTGTLTVSGGSIVGGGGAVEIDDDGITIAEGTGVVNSIKYGSGGKIYGYTSGVTRIAIDSAEIVHLNLTGGSQFEFDGPGNSLHGINEPSLGESADAWGDAYIDGTDVRLGGIGSDTGTTLVLNGSNLVKKLTSTERDKTNVTDLRVSDASLSSLLKMRPIRFDYKEGARGVVGFSAERLAAVSPDLVNTDQSGPLSVREHALLAYLLSAVQRIVAHLPPGWQQ